ncbi:MAG: hypothetical protein GKR91_09060 [Pseudomonadales bacterium]|nr:hypothetical protein [Pseudomonadales bacterium]
MRTIIALVILSGALCVVPGSLVSAAETISDDLIAQELERATTDPDSEVLFYVEAPINEVFDFLVSRLADFSADVSSASFNHSASLSPGQLGVGSDRIVNLDDGKMLVHQFLSVNRPDSFAYLTDMERSTADIPIDYSIVYYRLTANGDSQTIMNVTAVYKSSSSLLSMFVRRAFNSALEADFSKATEILGAE